MWTIKPALTVVIPTFNRRAVLERALGALFAQSVAEPWDIVVVDDGSSDGTAEWVAAIAANQPPVPFRVVVQTNQGSGAARNRGVAAAQGRVLLFLDDDILAEPQLVAAHLAAHQRAGPNVAVLGKLRLDIGGRPDPFARYERRRWQEHYARLEQDPSGAAFRDCFGGNLSVGRETFLACGGFATDLPRYHDIELGYRLSASGVRFMYAPDAVGTQVHLKNARVWAHELEKAGAAGLVLMERHPAMLAELMLGAYRTAPAAERVVRTGLLAIGGPTRPIWLVSPLISRTGLARAWYRVLMRYFYWRGVRAAVPDRALWNALTRTPRRPS